MAEYVVPKRYWNLKHSHRLVADGRPAALVAVALHEGRMYGGVVFDEGLELLTWLDLPDEAYAGMGFTYYDQRGVGAEALRMFLRAAEAAADTRAAAEQKAGIG